MGARRIFPGGGKATRRYDVGKIVSYPPEIGTWESAVPSPPHPKKFIFFALKW